MSDEEKEPFIEIVRTMPWLYQPILDKIAKHFGDCNSLLDVACGDGYLLEQINERFPGLDLIGHDIDHYFIKEARRKYPFQFEVRDAFLDTDGNYDIVTCNLALHHFENPLDLIRKLYDHCGKSLIISDQLRPSTQKELEQRLQRRKEFIGDREVSFYKENARASILEAYSRDEVNSILDTLSLPFSVDFIDTDYYERFVTVFEK